MADLLKDVYDQVYINKLATAVISYYPSFKHSDFITAVFDSSWHDKELKARTVNIANQLNTFIDLDYLGSLLIIQKIADQFTGYQGMFIPTFVEHYGLDDFSASIPALAHITQFASAEFAVRPFIVKYPKQMQTVLLNWTNSNNEHHRRLASEGCRPRLPWAMSLPEFKNDPTYLLPILENLKHDDSEYVRRSVANNLNDIAKDHPEIVINIARRWLNERDSLQTKRLVKHACRSLLKQAHPDALYLFGFLPPEYIEIVDFSVDKVVKLGESIHFSFQVYHQKRLPLNKLRIEFAIDFMKKNGKQARKIFQLSESVINKNHKVINKSFSFKKISTRQYYGGLHSIVILINGQQLHKDDFILTN